MEPTQSTEWNWFRVPSTLYHRMAELDRAATVYVALCRHANDAGECSVSQATLASVIGITDRRIRDRLETLERLGLIRRTRHRRGADTYILPDYAEAIRAGRNRPVNDSQDRTKPSGQGIKTGRKRPKNRTKSSGQTGRQRPPKKSLLEEDSLKKRDSAVPAALSGLMHGWNDLGNDIVAAGNHVRGDRPSKAVLAAWNRRKGDSDLREATEDITALLAAVRKASFCHGQGWFTLPWIFGKNKNGELNAPRLLAGAFDQAGNGKPKTTIGPGQRHPADYPTQEGQF